MIEIKFRSQPSFDASRGRSDSFQVAGTTRRRSGNRKFRDTFRYPYGVKVGTPDEDQFYSHLTPCRADFSITSTFGPLGNSLILSKQSLSNKRMRGTDYQNQFNSFAGLYRQNVFYSFLAPPQFIPSNFSCAAPNSFEKKNHNNLFRERH